MSIKFVDYTFDLMETGDIVLDAELKPDQLMLKDGDKFEVVLVDGAIILKKIR